MKHILTAGTDVASVLLFDPASLPDGVDGCKDPGDLFPKLEKQGRLCWISTDGDGRYLLHVYVEEAPPEGLARLLKDPIRIEAFSVASGKLYFAGAEYGFHLDDSMLRKHPHMGSFCEIASGSYALELYRAESASEALSARFAEMATPSEASLHGAFGGLVALAVIAVLAALISVFFLPWKWWGRCIAGPAVLLTLAAMGVWASKTYQNAEKKWQEVQREFPSLVAVMRRNAG